MRKKLLSILLVVCMLATMIPILGVSSLAAPEGEPFTATGGAVSGIYYLNGDVTLTSDLTVDKGTTLYLDLYGKILNLDGHRIIVNGTLNIKDNEGATERYFYDNDGDGCYESYDSSTGDGKIAIVGGVITGGNATADNAQKGGAICNYGTFNLNSGNIVGNKISAVTGGSAEGGAVANIGTFNMTGGVIAGNLVCGQTYSNGDNFGGGVFNIGSFTMSAGEIKYNKADGEGSNDVESCDAGGGGLGNQGTFTMNGGTISNNSSQLAGGGVDNRLGGVITLNGGSIANNTAVAGGGMYVESSSKQLDLLGGSVTDNTTTAAGAGVYLAYTDTNIGGSFTATNNKVGSIANNLYLKNVSVNVDGGYTGNCGVTLSNITGVFTDTVDEAVKANFTSDRTNYCVKYNADEQLEIGKYSVSVEDSTTVLVNPKSALPGATINVSANPTGDNYITAIMYYKTGDDSSTTTITDGKFTMPDYDVTVRATTAAKRTVTLTTPENGTLALEKDTTLYAPGETVKLTATPAKGYTLSAITVTKAGGGNVSTSGTTFVMPDDDVTVSVTFVTDESTILTNIPYIDANGKEQICTQATKLTGGSATTLYSSTTSGWYVVSSDVTYTGTLTTSGAIHIILVDGAKMKISGVGTDNPGIKVTGSNSLAIYGQSGQSGELNVLGGTNGAGIGGGNGASGSNITINGGIITATGAQGAAGIGGGYYGTASNITINGGTVTATGSYDGGAGIGGGYKASASNIFINGGTVTATGGGTNGIGIGCGYQCTTAASNIKVNGDLTVFADTVKPPKATVAHDSTTDLGNNTNFKKQYVVIKLDENKVLKDVPYIDANGELKTCPQACIITSSTILDTKKCDGWYVVNSSFTTSTSYTCTGNIHIILMDDQTLTISGVADNKAGICVTGTNSLNIYGQSGQTGALNVTGGYAGAGIGGGNGAEGKNITINGGIITAIANIPSDINRRYRGAGIGGGYGAAGSNITINGGTVTATGDLESAGIGGGNGAAGSNITINGGTVTATGGASGAGIGGGYQGAGTNITINGGTVNATTKSQGACIGGGKQGAGTNITINGGTVTAAPPKSGDASGIGGGLSGAGSNITINGGTVTANGGRAGAAIGGGRNATGSYITINGGTVNATGGTYGAAGIGGGYNKGAGTNITINGGIVVATGGSKYETVSGIGCGSYCTTAASDIKVNGELFAFAGAAETPSSDETNLIEHSSTDDIASSFASTPEASKQYAEILPGYAVNYAYCTNGEVSGVIVGYPNRTVTPVVTPAPGYALDTLSVKTASDEDVTVTDGSFVMPAESVTVSATFTIVPHTLTVKYVGAGATTTDERNLTIGESYEIETPSKTGYNVDKSVVSGTMGIEDEEIVVTYTKLPDATVNASYKLTYSLKKTGLTAKVDISNLGDSFVSDNMLIYVNGVSQDFTVDGKTVSISLADANVVNDIKVFYNNEIVKTISSDAEFTETAFEAEVSGKGTAVVIDKAVNVGLDNFTAKDENNEDITLTEGAYILATDSATFTATAYIIPDEVAGAKYYAAITLNDTLDINFKANNFNEGFKSENLSVEVNGTAIETEYKDGEVTGMLSHVASNQLANTLSVEIYYDGEFAKAFTYSVETYCNKVLSVGTYNEKNLVRAVMNYGYEVQQAFGYETTDTAISNTWHLDLSGLAMPGASEIAYNKTDKVTGLSANLTLGSSVFLNITVTGDSITEDDVKITNQNGERVPEDRIKVEGNVITVSNISAHKLSNTYRFEILDTNVFYGVGTYCGNMKGDATVGNVCYAIYYYSQMADACTY